MRFLTRREMAEEKENEEVENLFRKGEKEGPKMLEELEPYFQLVLEEPEDSETGRFKGAVQTLEERVDELSKRVSVLEEIGEEIGSSSSEDGYEREWRWERGSWWFRAPLVKSAPVNARHWRKITGLVEQMLEQEGRKNDDEKWKGWVQTREGGKSASGGCNPVNCPSVFSSGAGSGSLEP